MASMVSSPVAPLAVSRASVAVDSANTARLPRTRRRCAGQLLAPGGVLRGGRMAHRLGHRRTVAERIGPGSCTGTGCRQVDRTAERTLRTMVSRPPCDKPQTPIEAEGGVMAGDRDDLLAPLLPGGDPIERLLRGAQFFSPGTPTPGLPGAAPAAVGGRPRSSGTSAGATTRWCGPRTGSTAPGRARGRCMSRTASSPGRPSRPTIRRWGRTRRSTSRAAARAGRRSPGTPTRPRGCATPMCGLRCCSCGARRASGSGTRSRPGRRSAAIRSAPPATSATGARAGSSGRAGRRSAS